MLMQPEILGELPAPNPDILPEVHISLDLPSSTIESGGQMEASLVIENTSGRHVTIHSEQPLYAFIVVPGTPFGSRVGT